MGGGVEEAGRVAVGGYYGDLVAVVDGQVGVYEDEEVGREGWEWESVGEDPPGVRVGVEDDCEERRRHAAVRLCVACGGVDGVHFESCYRSMDMCTCVLYRG